MRRGDKKDLKPEKLKVGEFAVPTDTGEVYIKTSENITKGIATLKADGKLEQMPNFSDVGAAPKGHASSTTNYGVSSPTNYGHAMASSATPLVAGAANVGTETSKFARGDHVHPVQTSVSGNAGTATKLQTSRTIAISGGATGKATSFNGSANITIPVTAIDPTYLSSATPISKGGTNATTSSEALTNLGAVPKTTMINSKSLSSDINLNANDISAIALNGHIGIPINADLNDYTQPGNYGVGSNEIAATLSNCPIVASFTMTVRYATLGDVYVCQELYQFDNGHKYYRTKLESGWIPWQETYDTTKIIPISGGGTGATTAASALANLGAVPQNRTINNKALSSNIDLTASDVGTVAIDSNRISIPSNADLNDYTTLGNYCCGVDSVAVTVKNAPTGYAFNLNVIMPLGTNSSFLAQELFQYNKGTRYYRLKGPGNWSEWQKNYDTSNLTYETIGAVPTTRTINSKSLSSDVMLIPSDIGAADLNHSHPFSTLTSKPTTLSGYGITDAVPASRTVNSKSLSANISLSASDVGAATKTQGSKADSAIQGVKVNGTLLTPDSSNVVNVDATSISAATIEQGAKADSAIQGIKGNGTIITPDADKIVNVTPANIGAVPTSRTINNKDLSSNILLAASDIGAAESSHNHSASNITSGTLPISRGGTGATSASSALSNLGVTISSGTWTPTLASRNGTNPTYSTYYKYARYYRINNLVYITFHMKVNISNQGTDYACVKGLPFTASNNMNGQSLALHECYGGIDQRPATANIGDSSSIIYVQNSSGEYALQWRTGDTWVGFSGCYMKS